MGLARYRTSLCPGSYQLLPNSLCPLAAPSKLSPDAVISLDSPCVFALDASHLAEFMSWYHRVGGDCSYVVPIIVDQLHTFESAVGARVAHYWEHEVGEGDRERTYYLDTAKVGLAQN